MVTWNYSLVIIFWNLFSTFVVVSGVKPKSKGFNTLKCFGCGNMCQDLLSSLSWDTENANSCLSLPAFCFVFQDLFY